MEDLVGFPPPVVLRLQIYYCKGLSIYYVIRDEGAGGFNPFSALNKLKNFHFILFNADLCLRVLSRKRFTHFVRKVFAR